MSGCIEWAGFKTHQGYGRTRFQGKTMGAHRAAYIQAKGPIPPGLTIDHLCRNRGCVNPDHLEAVTQRENNARGFSFSAVNARKTQCPEGHEYVPEAGGRRRCRTCALARLAPVDKEKKRAYERDWWAKNREVINTKRRERYEQNKQRA